MTTPAQTPADDSHLAERYGKRRPPNRRLLIGLGAAAALVALAFTFWVTVIDRSKITWQDHSFSVRSASEVVITFDVQLHAGATGAVCTVHALNAVSTEVGLRDVTVEGGADHRARMTVTVPTSEEATTGLVRGCVAR
ncbi:hypothetical protein Kisp01_16980 [Kineosporia sp. NBRC 101677]|uniref:DUF4307 domain-containing protein n=1 Tax=Kineosporia sp. NBRC 101677 TaxID=3032197 RepID=UPI0024A326DB|nr:DUF4307 domain-containing protein [Kineosporia sp. NBRC 101677]GLY14683.1 hypothetical protein Kisp01_16980 [Kineosporia sp. NBRC 101677]